MYVDATFERDVSVDADASTVHASTAESGSE
jgi:hypothetical protein